MVALTLTATASLTPLSSPAAAQTKNSYICMQKRINAQNGNNTFNIIVKEKLKSLFETRGFNIASCNGRLAQIANYKQQICGLVQAPSLVRQGFAESYGATPSELCNAVS